MKRTLWTILLAAMLLFAACAPKAGPLTLPDADDVTEVRLEYGGESVVRAGPGWIGMLLEDLAAAQPTSKATVQDVCAGGRQRADPVRLPRKGQMVHRAPLRGSV